jgi:hypothetical protein
VQHQDLLKYILVMIEVRKLSNQAFVIEHVKQKDYEMLCNAKALARGAQKPSKISDQDLWALTKTQERTLAVSQALFAKSKGSSSKACRKRF